MEKLFYKKWTSIATVVAIIVIVLLLCMLLTTLAQMAALNQYSAEISTLIAKAQNDEQAQKQLIEYKKTDAYVIEWAHEQGLINDKEYLFIKNLK